MADQEGNGYPFFWNLEVQASTEGKKKSVLRVFAKDLHKLQCQSKQPRCLWESGEGGKGRMKEVGRRERVAS